MLKLEEIREGAAGWDGLRDVTDEGVGLGLWYIHNAVLDALESMVEIRPPRTIAPVPRDQVQRAMIYLATRQTPVDAATHSDGEILSSFVGWVLSTSARALKTPMEDRSERGIFDWKVGPNGPCKMVENVVAHQAWSWLTSRGFRVSNTTVAWLGAQGGPEIEAFAEKVRRWDPPAIEGDEEEDGA